MGGVLRQSTAATLMMGPFLDENDGRTVETGLTIAQADVKLSKNGGTKAAKNSATSATHDSNGDYSVPVDTIDTGTVGRLRVSIDKAGAGPVWDTFQVIEEAVYDALYAASATGYSVLDSAAVQTAANAAIVANHLDHLLATDYDPASKPGVATALLNELIESDAGVSRYTANALEQAPTGGSAPTAADIRAEIDANSTQLAAIVADTNELQGDWVDGGRLDLILDARASQASVDDVPTVSEFNARTLAAADYFDPAADTVVNVTNVAAIGTGGITAASIATDAIDADALAADAIAEINATVDTALTDIHLDHLLAATYDPAAKPGAADALLNEIVESDAGVSRFTANALEQAPTGGSAPTVGQIADAVWTEAIADHSGVSGSTAEALAAAGGAGDPWITTLPGSYTGSQAGKVLADVLADTNELQTDDIPGAIAALNDFDPATDTVATVTTVGSVTGAVGSVTAPVTAGTVSDKTGYALSSAGIQAIWDALTSALTTASSIGKLLVDNINATISSRASQTSVDDVPTTAEFNARTLASADYFDPATDVVASVTAVGSVTGAVGSVTGNVVGSVGSVLGGINTSAGVIQTFDALDTAQDIEHDATQAAIAALNDLDSAAAQAAAAAAIAAVNLDHIAGTAASIPAIPAGTYLDQIMDDGTAVYDRTTDSLQAIADNAGGGGLDAAGVRAAVGLASANLDTQLADLPTVAEFEARTIVSANYGTSANQTTLLNRFGAFTGSGVNTVLGFFQALMRSDATTPSDVGGTYDDATDSLQAISDSAGGSVPTVGEIADAVWSEAIADHSSTVGSTAESLAAAESGGGLDAAGVRAAIGMAADNLDTQLADIPTVAEFNARTLASASYGTAANQTTIIADIAAVPTAAEIDTQLSNTHGVGNWASTGVGTGARTVVITVNDGTAPLENALVRLTEGANTFSGFTDVNGELTFNLDDATYNVAITKAGYSFTGTTLIVNGNETATYSMTPITFSAPANPAQTTVAVTVVSGTGAAVAGRVVEFLLQSAPTALGLIYVDTRVTAVVPANGITTAALYKGATYKMMVVGGSPWQDLTIPAAAGDSYTDVPPLVV